MSRLPKLRIYWLVAVPAIICLVAVSLQIASSPKRTIHFTAAQLDEVDMGMRKHEIEKVLGCPGVFEDFSNGSVGHWMSEDGWIAVDFDQYGKACFIECRYPQKDDWTWTHRVRHWLGL